MIPQVPPISPLPPVVTAKGHEWTEGKLYLMLIKITRNGQNSTGILKHCVFFRREREVGTWPTFCTSECSEITLLATYDLY